LNKIAIARGTVSFLVALVAWELIARFAVHNSLFLAGPIAVAQKSVELWKTGELQKNLLTSWSEFAVGFALSAIVGIGVGVLLAHSQKARHYVDPWVSMLYATPLIALGPVFILWLGIGLTAKVAVIFLTAVFPILLNTVSGLRETDPQLVEVAYSFGAVESQVYRIVRFPAALPFIIVGLRLGIARALVGIVVAEFFGARAGIGFMILTSAQTFDTASVFLGVIILAIAGVGSTEFLKWLEMRLAPWRYSIGQPE
jgi:ABC-type nitrate/sulfonate/bicarbonate transport system permease component